MHGRRQEFHQGRRMFTTRVATHRFLTVAKMILRLVIGCGMQTDNGSLGIKYCGRVLNACVYYSILVADLVAVADQDKNKPADLLRELRLTMQRTGMLQLHVPLLSTKSVG